MYNRGRTPFQNQIARWRRLFPGARFGQGGGGYFQLGLDLQEAAVSLPGRYEGNVKRESDGAEFKRAIELDPPSGNQQPIRIYDVVGGGLPTTPQWSGNALLFGGSLLFFTATDSVADRKFACLGLGNFLFSFSKSTYHDGRPDVKLAGVLKKL